MRIAIVHQYYIPDLSAVAHLIASLAEHRAQLGDQVTVVTSGGACVPGSITVHEDSQNVPLGPQGDSQLFRPETGRKTSQSPARQRSPESVPASRCDRANPRVYRLWTPRLGKRTLARRALDYASFYALAAVRMLSLPRQDVVVLLTTPPWIGWTGVLHRLIHRRTKLLLWNMDCYPEAAVQSGLLRSDGLADRVLQVLNRSLLGHMDHVVCLDTAMVELLDAHYGIFRRSIPVTVIPNWEPLALFPKKAAAETWPEADRLGLSGRFVVLYLGNAGFGHRFETVLAAAERLRNEPVTFLFVGGGKQFAWLEAEKRRRRLESIVLHGYVRKEQTSSVMATANCALITLRDEMLGVMSPSKLHGNLAAGLPVLYVGPAKSNVDEAVRRFDCGVSLRHGDVEGLVRFVHRCIHEPGEYAAMRRRARQAFEQAYCDAVNLPRFDAILDGLVAGDGKVGITESPAEAARQAA